MPPLRRLLLHATVGQRRDLRCLLRAIYDVPWRRLPNAAERRELSDRRHKNMNTPTTQTNNPNRQRRFAEVTLLDRSVNDLHARIRDHVENQNPLDRTSYSLLADAARKMDEANVLLKAYNRINAV